MLLLMCTYMPSANYGLDASYDYFVALVIGIGIAMFMASTDDLSFGTDYLGNTEVASAKWTGVMLLALFLFFDSLTK